MKYFIKYLANRAMWTLLLLALSLNLSLVAQEIVDEKNAENTKYTARQTEVEEESQTLWYRSNQMGMALEFLENTEYPEDFKIPSTPEWHLKITTGINDIATDSRQRLKILYRWGQQHATWLRTYSEGRPIQEQHKLYGKLQENIIFDEDSGNLAEISRYAAGALLERRLFFYDEKGGLARSLLYDKNGELARESTFRLDGAGRLIKLKISRYDQQKESVQDLIQYQLQGLDTFIRRAGQNGRDGQSRDKYLVKLFDGQNRQYSQVLYVNDAIAKRSNFTYSPDGKLARTVLTEPQRRSQYDYNKNGTLRQKQSWRQGLLWETEIYRYDKLGRLTNKKNTVWRQKRHTEERLHYISSNLPESKIDKIEFYSGDKIDKIRFYNGLYSYHEELYFAGEAVAKVYYSYDDQLYTEVIFANVPSPEVFSAEIP